MIIEFIENNVGPIVSVVIVIVGLIFLRLISKRKKKKESISLDIYNQRKNLRELEYLLNSLQKYFQRVEKKVDLSHLK